MRKSRRLTFVEQEIFGDSQTEHMKDTPNNQSAAANRRPAGQSDGWGNLAAIVTADRAFPAAVAELGRSNTQRP